MRKYIIQDPNFCEYVFHCISNATQQQKNNVPFGFEEYVHHPNMIKKLATEYSLDRRLLILTKLGYDWKLYIAPMGEISKEEIKNAVQEYKEKRRHSVIDRMIGKNHFVIGSKELMMGLALMAMNCHSEYYRINKDYHNIAKKITKASEKLIETEEFKEALEDIKLIVRVLLGLTRNKEFYDFGYLFTYNDLTLLLFLFLNRNTFLKANVIIKHLKIIKPITIRTCLSRLHKNKFVEKFKDEKSYSISTLGIQVVSNYISRVLHDALHPSPVSESVEL